jgi:hypothetical protein
MNQKEEERLIIEYFRKHYSAFPKGRLAKSESPDFILKVHPKNSIGIEITRLHDGSLPKSNPGFPVAEFTKSNIENTIRNKEAKLTLYQQKKIRLFWLIITTDYIHLPEGGNLPDTLESLKFETVFDKVFLFDLFEKKIFELSAE